MAPNPTIRDRIVALRLTKAEYGVLAAAAMMADRPVSSFVRIHILAEATRALEADKAATS